MKKTILTGLLLTLTGTANANDNFTGWFVGGELSSTKHELSFSDEHTFQNGSRSAGLGIFGGYGFDFAGNFIGQAEAKLRTGGSKTKNEFGDVVSKEKYNLTLAYLQGYRINAFLPYIKVGVGVSNVDIDNNSLANAGAPEVEGSSAIGFGYGVGVKYAINEKFDAGIEFYKAHLSGFDDIKFKATTVSAGLSYRF